MMHDFIGGDIPQKWKQGIQAVNDAVSSLAEMIIKSKEEYILERLEQLGYSRDCVKVCRYRFIPVQYSTEDNDVLVIVVDAPCGEILFAFIQRTRQVEVEETEGYVAHKYEVEFDERSEDTLGADICAGAVECAWQAYEDAVSHMSLSDVL
ncbi:MAG: hypothetical protein LIP12_00165 [Clostridiales bacterium]|nr:hypothetical protein [Clostridiales bacterium]